MSEKNPMKTKRYSKAESTQKTHDMKNGNHPDKLDAPGVDQNLIVVNEEQLIKNT